MRRLPLGMLLASVFILTSPAAMAFSSMMHTTENNPTTKAYMRAMDKMHDPMMKGISDSDPDVAFVKGMIPHHEGAIDMAKIELKYGKDPEMQKLAQSIIDAQKKEIAFMKVWLKKHNK